MSERRVEIQRQRAEKVRKQCKNQCENRERIKRAESRQAELSRRLT